MSLPKNALTCRVLAKNSNTFSLHRTSMKHNFLPTVVPLKLFAMFLEITILNLNPLDLQINLQDKDIRKVNYLNLHILLMMPSKNAKAESETVQVSRRVLDNLVNLRLLPYPIGVLLIMIVRWIIHNNFTINNMSHTNRQNSNNKLQSNHSIRLIHSNFSKINRSKSIMVVLVTTIIVTSVIQLFQDITKIICLLN